MSQTGGRSQCPACQLLFTSTHSFDKHRVGTFKPLMRRCLSASELTARGWSPDPRGFWRKPAPAGTFTDRQRSIQHIA
jgi:hypothetical protein